MPANRANKQASPQYHFTPAVSRIIMPVPPSQPFPDPSTTEARRTVRQYYCIGCANGTNPIGCVNSSTNSISSLVWKNTPETYKYCMPKHSNFGQPKRDLSVQRKATQFFGFCFAAQQFQMNSDWALALIKTWNSS